MRFSVGLIILGLMAILILAGCATVPEKEVGDLTPAEQEEVAKDTDTTSLAGKAVNFGNCVDPDSTSTFDKNSLLTKSTTTYGSGSFTDKCYTWYKRTPQEKTRLIEGTCKSEKLFHWYADCDVSFGKGAKCMDGKCVKTPTNITCYDNSGCPSETKKYCDASGSACSSSIGYYCVNPGTPQSKCVVAGGGGGGCSNPCTYGCSNGICCKESDNCVKATCGNITVPPYCKNESKITKSIDTCTGIARLSSTNCDKECNPSVGSGCSGSGYTIKLGSGCERNNLRINNNLKYDCSQKKGYLNPLTCATFNPQYDAEKELLEFGKFRCLEPCTPGQAIITCDDDEYYQHICNDNGLGWITLEDQPVSCPNGKTCKSTDGSDFKICK